MREWFRSHPNEQLHYDIIGLYLKLENAGYKEVHYKGIRNGYFDVHNAPNAQVRNLLVELNAIKDGKSPKTSRLSQEQIYKELDNAYFHFTYGEEFPDLKIAIAVDRKAKELKLKMKIQKRYCEDYRSTFFRNPFSRMSYKIWSGNFTLEEARRHAVQYPKTRTARVLKQLEAENSQSQRVRSTR